MKIVVNMDRFFEIYTFKYAYFITLSTFDTKTFFGCFLIFHMTKKLRDLRYYTGLDEKSPNITTSGGRSEGLRPFFPSRNL